MDASELTASFARLDASRDDIAGVVAFLRDPRVAAHAALQKRGWITLAELMPEPRTGIQTAEAVAALNAGVLAAAVAALRTHRAEEDVQVWAGVALTSLATGFPEEVGVSGAVEATMDGMREHADDCDVLNQGCKTLATLTGPIRFEGARGEASRATAEANARRAGDAGAVPLVVAALRAFGTRLELHGVSALAHLVVVRKNMRRAQEDDALGVCIHILCSRQPQTAPPLRYLAIAINSLVIADIQRAGARAGEAGAVEVVVRHMQHYARRADPSFQDCFLLLSALLTFHEPNAIRAWRAGALPLVAAALNGHGGLRLEEGMQEQGPVVLQLLHDAAADATAAADAAAEELLASEAAGPPAAKCKKKRKKKRPTGEASQAADVAPPEPPVGDVDAAAAEALPEPPQSPPPQRDADGGRLCSICLDMPPCVVLLPCRHVPVCASAACIETMCGLCPLCRAPVADTLTVFL
jgi:hypothetical protein